MGIVGTSVPREWEWRGKPRPRRSALIFAPLLVKQQFQAPSILRRGHEQSSPQEVEQLSLTVDGEGRDGYGDMEMEMRDPIWLVCESMWAG
ncbi:hypothetical protein CDV31_003757 [Fusarium ambrosium]|uniref:Uncharacterized protein n=1 Tax=Fusarium ambrosium TaxID=131363 RepID=A0A428USS4_9HYPO|nr:hypothetical protein CDV31_003757 [Fusarium ambrosium]